ncbi:MAG: rod shape-determining protein RodA [Dissulfurispiraceae bacterium]|jgi:rod shape determining protein RodA|nr:rod shape-determining protein RodA [Dissulfurispiraceae bacterium]
MMLKIDRRLVKNFDWITFGLIITIALIGIATIFSATRLPVEGMEGSQPAFYLKQILWLFISILALFAVVMIDYVWFYRLAYIFYAIGLVLLIAVLMAGKSSLGAQRWINLGFVAFQPSEFFRLAFIMAFSSYLVNKNLYERIPISCVFIFGIIPLFLIVLQPDLGTAIMLMSLFVILSIMRGLSRKIITLAVIVSLISIPFLGHIFWESMKDYQKNRLVAFVDPEIDPSGIGYHINQSKIAIGSGSFIGKGYLKGTQGPLRFLPEKHTDFIFSVFSEEWGFLGSMTLFTLYIMVFLRGLDTAKKAKDEFSKLAATGIVSMFFIYFLVNTGMALGIMPVVGVPLPFMSYGGTALLSNFIAAGLLINIRTRRFELFY